MRLRGVASLGALLLVGNALFGVGFSGATWSQASTTAIAVIAADDWTPPVVSVSPLASTVQGTVTVNASASDARSSIAAGSTVVEYRAVGAPSWTAFTTCTLSGTNPVAASCPWNTALLPDGSYEVRARSSDTAGYSTTSATVATRVDNAGVRLTTLATYLRGTVPVTGTMSGGGSSTAQIYLESTTSGGSVFTELNNACTAAPVSSLTCQWDTTKVTDGTYDVRARAVTTLTSLDLQTGVIVDNKAPNAALSVRAGVLSGNVALNATASDATSGVASVALQYAVGGSGSWVSCSPTTGTYTCNLDTTTLTNGATYDFRARVTDAAGNLTLTATQSRVVDNSPASVAITSPASGTVLGGVTTVTINAASPRGVSSVRVEYRTGAGAWSTACTAPSTPFSCSWDATALAGGSYELRAVVTETFGGGTPVSASVPITVNNSVGTVTVTSPAAGAFVSGTVTLSASTASPTGVTSVALQVRKGATGGWTTICTRTVSPYSCSWVTPAEYGTAWQVQAVMTQGNQKVATSTAVDVTVRNIDGSVAITSPATGSTVRGSVALSATAASNAGVTSVKFQMKAPDNSITECAATGTGPYSCSWNTTAITYGSYVLTAIMTRGDGSTLTSAAVTVTVDNRVLQGADVQGANGGVAGIPDRLDRITLTYSGLANLSTIQSGLVYGTPSALAVTLTGAPGTKGDTISFANANIGAVSAGGTFFGNNKDLVYTGSTLTASQGSDAQGRPVTVLTITLGTPASTPTSDTKAFNLSWTPSAAATDNGGTACLTTGVTESGLLDADF